MIMSIVHRENSTKKKSLRGLGYQYCQYLSRTQRGAQQMFLFYLFPLVLVIFYYWIFVYLYYLPLDHSSLMVTYAYLLLFMYSKCYVHKLLNLQSTFSKAEIAQNKNSMHLIILI